MDVTIADSRDDHQAAWGQAATTAGFWNALDGGKDNFAPDRDAVAALTGRLDSTLGRLPQNNRQFLTKACEYLADAEGITQFIDCGPGLPAHHNRENGPAAKAFAHVHGVVQAKQPGARVLYVDNHPIVLAHARALLAVNDRVAVVDGDIFNPRELLKQDDVRTFFDWTQPIAVIQTATLHHVPGPIDTAAAIMQAYVDALPAGSLTVISHFLNPEREPLTQRVLDVQQQLADRALTGVFRTQQEIQALFPDQDLIAPGITTCGNWPDPGLASLATVGECIAGGIGRVRSHEPALQQDAQ